MDIFSVISRSWEKDGMGLPKHLMFDRASLAALLTTSVGDLLYPLLYCSALYCLAFLPVASVNIA